ncbi:ABC-2 type transport system permease protein [Marinitoga hydrogenitolerans DSM 16785]|uniref:ABC-2 type transport system permease protein n=1 Tax=Marinitoga hydrogenitolerans (strain DSM 16785 / JCM 12826 / AT1271) TaxID=1122195 RepID=A0A1M5AAM2_MARH1|nr:ABC transporter permease [Marinitoga hydrogenitolerans]SHF27204.1 ABC-2 type transport system permease protein [Marinitoga hydrogenitolerans DSM 16785]
MWAIIEKELKTFFRKKKERNLFFIAMIIWAVTIHSGEKHIYNPYFTAGVLVSFFIPYIFGWIAFNEEKKNKNLLYLLSSPLDIKEVFAGKIIALFIFTIGVEFLIIAIGIIINPFAAGIYPTVSDLITLMLTIPIWMTVISAIMGISLMILDNPFIIKIVLFLLIYFFASKGEKIKKIFIISEWYYIIFGILLITGIIYLTPLILNKEKI